MSTYQLYYYYYECIHYSTMESDTQYTVHRCDLFLTIIIIVYWIRFFFSYIAPMQSAGLLLWSFKNLFLALLLLLSSILLAIYGSDSIIMMTIRCAGRPIYAMFLMFLLPISNELHCSSIFYVSVIHNSWSRDWIMIIRMMTISHAGSILSTLRTILNAFKVISHQHSCISLFDYLSLCYSNVNIIHGIPIFFILFAITFHSIHHFDDITKCIHRNISFEILKTFESIAISLFCRYTSVLVSYYNGQFNF